MRLVIFFILLIPFSAVCQKTKKVTVKHKQPDFTEVYYVLAGDQDVRHGEYTLSTSRFTIKGQYTNNTRTGIWEILKTGELEQRIDFSNDSVLMAKPFLLKDYWLESDSVKHAKPDRAPMLIGGMTRYTHYIMSTLTYPREAYYGNITGKVFVSAVVTADGKLINEKVESGPTELQNEGLRIVKILPDEWLPGKVAGKPVNTVIVVVVSFQLAK